MNEKFLTVSEINTQIKACFDSGIFKNLAIIGEVSGIKVSGGHAYFVLKDENSQINCVCFNCQRTYRPKDGEQVILRGGIDYYVKGGRLTFQAWTIEPYGEGLLAQKFEELKKRLLAEGLFDEARKKPIPRFPKKVLVVTSKEGAVIRDIVTTIRRKNPVITVVIKDVRVQGQGAAAEIARALETVDKLGYDVIIIARGGGSLEDLAPFYEETLVRAVYKMTTPVISAVGHETDYSLCDLVADRRAPTPTAAADIVAYDYYKLFDFVRDSIKVMTNRALDKLMKSYQRFQLANANINGRASGFYMSKKQALLSSLANLVQAGERHFRRKQDQLLAAARKITPAAEKKLINKEYSFNRVALSLDNLSPLKTMARGYFSVKKGDKVVRSVRELNIGDRITSRGYDGEIDSVVEKIKTNSAEEV